MSYTIVSLDLSSATASYLLLTVDSIVPFRFAGLDTIGTIVFLFNLIFFLLCLILITMRFCLFPETFKASLLHPTESLFMPGAVVALGTIFLNIGQYGLYNVGPWLNEAVLVIFWLFVVLSILASSCTYLLMCVLTEARVWRLFANKTGGRLKPSQLLK